MFIRLISTLFLVGLSAQSFAVCLTYEQGATLNCEFNFDDEEMLACKNLYGSEYLAFNEAGECSEDNARKLRKEISAADYIDGLSSRIDELDVILAQIDPNGKKQLAYLGANEYYDYKIYKEIYNEKQLALAFEKLHELKNIFKKRSYHKLGKDRSSESLFIKYALGYITLKDRYYLALLNYYHHYSKDKLRNKIEDSEKLNLALNKEIGIQILDKVFIQTRHVGFNEIEFLMSHSNKIRYEKLVLKHIKTEKDYARLVQFVALEESLVNRWGANRMSLTTISEPKVLSCGEGLVSFQNEGQHMSLNPVYQELVQEDRFAKYLDKIDELVVLNSKIKLVDYKSVERIVAEIIYENEEILAEFKDYNKWSDQEIKVWIKEQADFLVSSIEERWLGEVSSYTKTAILRGDDTNLKYIAGHMSRITFDRLKDIIQDDVVFIFSNIALEGDLIKNIKLKSAAILNNRYESWYQSISQNLATLYPELREDGLSSIFKKENYDYKLKETYQLAAQFMDAYLYKLKLEKKSFVTNPLIIRELRPTEPIELMAIKEGRLGYDQELMKLLTENKEFNQAYDEFKTSIEKDYIKSIEKLSKEQFTPKYLSQILEKITFKRAVKFYEKYPSNLLSDFTSSFRNLDYSKLEASGVNLSKLKNSIKEQSFFNVARDNTNIKKIQSYIPPVVVKKKTDNCVEASQESWFNWNNLKLAMVAHGIPFVGLPEYSPKPSNNSVSADANLGSSEIDNLVKKYNIDFSKNIHIDNKVDTKEISPEEGVLRILKIFNLENAVMAKHTNNKINLNLAPSKSEKESLIRYRLAKAREATLLLDVPMTTQRIVEYQVKFEKKYRKIKETKPLFERLANVYDQKSRTLPSSLAYPLIKEAIEKVIKGNEGKFEKFCQANISNYKDDKIFRTLFRTSPHLRSTLQRSIQTVEKCNALADIDQNLSNEIKTGSEVAKENIDGVFSYIGIGLIAATGIIMALGTFGVGGAVVPAAMSFLLMFDAAVLVPASLFSAGFAFNIHFIEQPKTLAFHRSLIDSQVDKEAFSTEENYQEAKSEMKMGQIMTVGEIGLNALFVGMTVQGLKIASGARARNILKKHNIPTRGFARPTGTKKMIEFLKTQTKKYGFRKAVGKTLSRGYNNALKYTPKYQPYTKDQLAEFLRILFVKKGEELGIENVPWLIKNDVEKYLQALKGRYKEFTSLDVELNQLVKVARDQKKMPLNEFFKNFNQTKLSFVPKAFVKALRSNGVDGVIHYINRYDEVLEKLMELRGRLLKNRATQIESIIAKIDEVQTLQTINPTFYTNFKSAHSLDYLQRILTTEELTLLGEISRNQNTWYSSTSTLLGKFKPAFKDHKRVMQELKTLTFSSGQSFKNDPALKESMMTEDDDIVSFYQNMIEQDGSVATKKDIQDLRGDIEGLLPL